MQTFPMPPVESPSQMKVCYDTALQWKCLLYDDGIHSAEEVALQVMKATGSSTASAIAAAVRAHERGAVVVTSGPRSVCEHCAAVLGRIGLRADVYR